MPNTLFIDTNKLPRKQTPQGELTEILNNELAGAKNVLGTLRWLKSGEKFHAEASDKPAIKTANAKVALNRMAKPNF